MSPEAPVLIGDQHREIARIDVVGRRRQPPAPVGQGERPEQPAVAVDDDGRALKRPGEIERRKPGFVVLPGEPSGEAGGKDDGKRRECEE